MKVDWQRFRTPLRWATGIGILVIILVNLSIQDIVSELLDLAWIAVLVNLIIKFVIRITVGLKWYLIVLIKDPAASFWRTQAAQFIGTAIGSVLPVFGTDLTVAYVYYRQSGQATSAISSILMDRIIGVSATILIASLMLLVNLERFMQIPVIPLLVCGIFIAAITAPFAVWFLMRHRKLLVSWWMPKKARKLLTTVRDDLEEYRTRGARMLLMNIGLASIIAILRILSVYTLALVIDAPGTLAEYAVIGPLMFLMIMVPLPVASIGMEQGVFIVMLGLIGIEAETAFAMSIVNRVLTTISVLPGILCLLTGWGWSRPVSQDPVILNKDRVQ